MRPNNWDERSPLEQGRLWGNMRHFRLSRLYPPAAHPGSSNGGMSMIRMCRKPIAALIAIMMLLPPWPPTASAELIGTEAALRHEQRSALVSAAEAVLLREAVATRLARLGVHHDALAARIRALTDDELAALASDIDSMPAGAGAIEVIGLVFLVLLILELVGVTDVFKKI